MKGMGLGQKEVTEWYLVFMFAKMQIRPNMNTFPLEKAIKCK
jgi:hypothetical protein